MAIKILLELDHEIYDIEAKDVKSATYEAYKIIRDMYGTFIYDASLHEIESTLELTRAGYKAWIDSREEDERALYKRLKAKFEEKT